VALLAVLALAPAPAALAQSAGDRQYADPLVGDGDQPQQSPQPSPDDGGDDGSTPATPAPAPAPDSGAGAAAETAAPGTEAALPRTGGDARLLAGLGAALIAAGALGLAVARRSRDAHA
jgi:LPXTG-motif cell wall-anchored protein